MEARDTILIWGSPPLFSSNFFMVNKITDVLKLLAILNQPAFFRHTG